MLLFVLGYVNYSLLYKKGRAEKILSFYDEKNKAGKNFTFGYILVFLYVAFTFWLLFYIIYLVTEKRW
jgi:hypothetical protein